LLTKPNTKFSTSWRLGCNEVKSSVGECKNAVSWWVEI